MSERLSTSCIATRPWNHTTSFHFELNRPKLGAVADRVLCPQVDAVTAGRKRIQRQLEPHRHARISRLNRIFSVRISNVEFLLAGLHIDDSVFQADLWRLLSQQQ